MHHQKTIIIQTQIIRFSSIGMRALKSHARAHLFRFARILYWLSSNRVECNQLVIAHRN